ncbi:undecaprenyl-diphosphate phosphatase [Xenorhabdus bovienii]|uniref:undecaprenyl-diphosphate phosphatase n=1 Tax=Xenorhabdus bovienii str. Intermedium TaxID=1379677 RepID=A0A077QHZ9_XENBV|nr:undecaprenyl-diphosphate phosphatase [Xenorhabdus bovienii]MDE9453327.1 undecaprenyl-diphosphate phosphatase [Xenorhabdus bovienii]MDE9480948.1 undecaprenyl-diphosphate phosphatase [Xenorhabdus bovienii]MDE9551181.1 undecaprenyl-diphosphate phosphatase [Xenorhabdus bovienii]CDH33129.1 putative phosphatase [Xenorhabdus bovienii str. Intermedium]
MLEQLNHNVFTFINATPDSSPAMILLAIFVAKYLVFIFPITLAVCWLWGEEKAISHQRIVVSKSCIAFAFAIAASDIIGTFVPHARPFVEGFGYNFLYHAPTASFPSNHGTAVFTFALAFIFWHRIRSGLCLMIIACVIAWARVYVGVHWPIDMIGAFLISLMGCAFSQIFWRLYGEYWHSKLIRLYQFCCAFFIRKGWIKN